MREASLRLASQRLSLRPLRTRQSISQRSRTAGIWLHKSTPANSSRHATKALRCAVVGAGPPVGRRILKQTGEVYNCVLARLEKCGPPRARAVNTTQVLSVTLAARCLQVTGAEASGPTFAKRDKRSKLMANRALSVSRWIF